MKLLFLTQKRDAPSTRWRILQFIPHFEKAGASCTVEDWPSGTLARLSLARKAAAYDVVVLQKRLLPKMLLNRLRRNARALVYEFDDGVTLKRTAEGGVRESPTRERRFRRTVREADAVITTNEHLARRAEQAGASPGRVHIFPPVIDLSRWRPK
ncbi:MAG: glycosyltransferase, partial [Planctomycetota bacterium]